MSNLEELLAECQNDYRNTLLNVLDDLWLEGRECGTLTVSQLNAINAATCELSVQWGLKGWHRAQGIDAAAAAETVEQGSVHEGPVRDSECAQPQEGSQ